MASKQHAHQYAMARSTWHPTAEPGTPRERIVLLLGRAEAERILAQAPQVRELRGRQAAWDEVFIPALVRVMRRRPGRRTRDLALRVRRDLDFAWLQRPEHAADADESLRNYFAHSLQDAPSCEQRP